VGNAAEPEVTIPQQGKKDGSPVQRDGIHYYPAGPVSKAFLNDESFICGIMGPFGSGKSTATVMKLIRNCQRQKRAADGWIRRRTAIIRNTYPELRTTTMKTWHQWVPQHLGRWREAGPPMHHIVDKANKLDWEVLFVALDKPDDVAKLLSMELSDAWINEAREVPKAILDGLTGRVGRYPPRWQAEATDVQIIMDTNPPDTDHWWYILAEQDATNERNRQLVVSMKEAEDTLRAMGVLKGKQGLMAFYRQPSGRASNAENLSNLRPGYYEFQIAGKDLDWIKVYVDGEYGFVMDGLPVYPEYKDSVHASKPFNPIPGIGLRLGFDWGLTPACTISQRMSTGIWLVHDEIVSERLGITSFALEVSRTLREKYPGLKVVSGRGDPSGDAVTPEESTCFKIMKANGVPICEPAITQDPVRRREGLAYLLKTLVDGEPAIRVHPRCSILRKGLAGGFHRKRVQVTGDIRYRDVPDKNKFSHVCEALEYDVVSAGEDRNVMMTQEDLQGRGDRQQFATTDYDPFGG
jgi:RecA/RadA recombinase